MPDEINYKWLHDANKEIEQYAKEVTEEVNKLADRLQLDREYAQYYFRKQIVQMIK